ncbi:MAG: hypothetical protein U5L76_00285 [Patescibacteria group bacterium]|nr:hypothetical protein [Patescibacteria group bacterium]
MAQDKNVETKEEMEENSKKKREETPKKELTAEEFFSTLEV